MKRWSVLLLASLAAAIVLVVLGLGGGTDLRDSRLPTAGLVQPDPDPVGFATAVARGEAATAVPDSAAGPTFALAPVANPLPVVHEFGDPPAAGLMFDVGTGQILWERHPDRELPIASLTKMMTAYLIATRHGRDERVLVSKEATRTGGSMVGVLPIGKRVRLEALLRGLLLVSGNDAATALAEHDAGSVERFVARMNAVADRLGLACTRFSSPHGLIDAGNHSCPRDLAVLTRADLSVERIAAIARSDHERMPFPVEGGFLDLYNINPFIRGGDPSITGLKTGYTEAAGRCYVTTAVRGGRELGVVLLDSPNPLEQVPKLLELGAAAP